MWSIKIALTVVLAALLPFRNALAQNDASGTLTVNGESTEIQFGYGDLYEDEITVILTDGEVPREAIPDRTYDLGANGDFRGVVIVVSAETQELLTGGWYELINAIHFHPVTNQQGDIGEPTVAISKYEDEILEGSVTTDGSKEIDGNQVSYEISFSVSLKKEAIEVTVTGANDDAAKAYEGWCRALFAGDVDKILAYASGETAEMMAEVSPDELAAGLEFQQMMMPNNIEILTSEKQGDETVLQVRGTRGMEVSTGTVTVFQEDGVWKIGEQSWTSDENAE